MRKNIHTCLVSNLCLDRVYTLVESQTKQFVGTEGKEFFHYWKNKFCRDLEGEVNKTWRLKLIGACLAQFQDRLSGIFTIIGT